MRWPTRRKRPTTVAERYRSLIDEAVDDSVFNLVGAVDDWLAAAMNHGSDDDRAEALHYRTVALVQRARDPVTLAERERLLISNEGIPAEAGYWLARTQRTRDAVTAIETSRAVLYDRLTGWFDPTLLTALHATGHARLLGRYTTALAALSDGYRDEYTRQPALQPGMTVEGRHYATGHTTALHAAAAEVDRLQQDIEKVTGQPIPPLEPITYDLVQAAVATMPVIYLAAANDSGYALIVTDTAEPQPVWLPGLTAHAATRRVSELQEPNTRPQLLGSVDDTVRWLAETALVPLADWIRACPVLRTGPIGLVAVGVTGALPIAAALLQQDGPAVWHLPYARTLTTDRQPLRPPWKVRICAAPQVPLLRRLPRTDRDITWLQERYGTHIRAAPDATRDDGIEALREGDVVELLCHGKSKPATPLDSALCLTDGELTVRDLLSEDRIGARLAILAACEGQRFDLRMSDEIIGLPLALHQAGTDAVIAGQWPVDDIPTGLLMRRLHDNLADGAHPAQALTQAQNWLRTSSRRELADTYPNGYQMLSADGTLRPYSHPAHWAGFTCSGYLTTHSSGDRP